jgi:hypothetical protein
MKIKCKLIKMFGLGQPKPENVFDALVTLNDDKKLLRYIQEHTKQKQSQREELITGRDQYGRTAFQKALNLKRSESVVLKLIEVGGHDLVTQKDKDGCTAFYWACMRKAPTQVILKLIEIGGRDLVMAKNNNGYTTLHCACNFKLSIEVFEKLIEIGGYQLVREKNMDGRIALHSGCLMCSSINSEAYNDCFTLLIKEGILAKIGGEFGIGGFFNCCTPHHDVVQNKIYKDWDKFAPLIEKTFESLSKKQRPPILHAAIIAKAPKHIIKDIIHRFDCIWTKDSLNRHPIDVAIENGFCFDELIEEIEAMAIVQNRPVIHTAAQYGLKWRSHMRELSESNVEEVVNGRDDLTGLRVFMLAGMNDDCAD